MDSKNFLNDKRAMEKLLTYIFYLIIVVIIFIGTLKFVNNYASEDAVKEQVLAKQIALFIDSAKPATTIVIDKDNFIVSINNNEINVKANNERTGYTYKFFTQNKITIEDKGGTIIISVS